MEFAKSQKAVENREKWRKLTVKSSMVPPTTPVVKGWAKVKEGRSKYSFACFAYSQKFCLSNYLPASFNFNSPTMVVSLTRQPSRRLLPF